MIAVRTICALSDIYYNEFNFMTHTPPVPSANTSPYPLREPPHEHTGHSLSTTAQKNAEEQALKPLTIVLLGGAVLVGIAATVARLTLGRRRRAGRVVKTGA